MITAPRLHDRSVDVSAAAVSNAMITPVRTPRPSQLAIALLAAPLAIVTALGTRAPSAD